MKNFIVQGLIILTVLCLISVLTDWIDPCVDAYVSPGNFYEQGELSISVINIADTIAPVELDIYTPSASDTYPVIIFQHGFSGSIKGYETISTHLASHGFVVVLPQMYPPGDFGSAPTPEEEATLGVQIISWVEDNINSHISPVTADTSLLGLAGHSRGGQTAYRMALDDDATEKVKALAGVDPVDGLEMFGQTLAVTGSLTFDIPTYILGTGLGPIVVDGFLACAPEEIGPSHFYAANPPPSWLVNATTHGHADMIDEEDYSDFCPGCDSDPAYECRDGMRSLTGGTLAAFFSGILQDNFNALAVLINVGSAPVPTEMEIKYTAKDGCEWDNNFNPGETVYGKAALDLSPDTSYPLYIVDDQTDWTDTAPIPTACIHCDTSPSTSFTTDSDGNMGCDTQLWENVQVDTLPAYFDIVIDVNGNGLFDVDIDFLNANAIAGFKVCLDDDEDGTCDDEDNCSAIPNGPDGGTCVCANEGTPCMSDGECGACGSCSKNQEDTDGDEIGDVCDESPYADLCQSYCDKCKCCVDLRDVQGRNIDYDACAGHADSTTCAANDCYWNEFGTGGGQCVIDICLENGNFDIFIDGDDLNIFKREYGRYDCACMPGVGADLCEKYYNLYTCCISLGSRNLDYDACAGYADSTTCAANDCYWNEFGTGGGQCVIDICLENGNFDIFIDGDDLNIFKREYGRFNCDCAP